MELGTLVESDDSVICVDGEADASEVMNERRSVVNTRERAEMLCSAVFAIREQVAGLKGGNVSSRGENADRSDARKGLEAA
jgi:hypothetical protein